MNFTARTTIILNGVEHPQKRSYLLKTTNDDKMYSLKTNIKGKMMDFRIHSVLVLPLLSDY